MQCGSLPMGGEGAPERRGRTLTLPGLGSGLRWQSSALVPLAHVVFLIQHWPLYCTPA